jgi:hypothetical protein
VGHQLSGECGTSSDVLADTLKARVPTLELSSAVNFPLPRPTTEAEVVCCGSNGGDSHATMLLPEEDSETFKRWVLPRLETM